MVIMTCREKFKIEHPDVFINDCCPMEFGYLPKPSYCDNSTLSSEEVCPKCWDREIPDAITNIEDVLNDHKKIGIDLLKDIPDQPKILDSGNRRQFETGAVRDIQDGKGRCDLLPLDVVSELLFDDVLGIIEAFKLNGTTTFLYGALNTFRGHAKWDDFTMLLEVSKHFEDGAKKYGENNWQKGIPVRCYIDSAVRHYLKFLRGDKDEPHDRAFVWNILCAIWTCKHKPELNDYRKPNFVTSDPNVGMCKD